MPAQKRACGGDAPVSSGTAESSHVESMQRDIDFISHDARRFFQACKK
jgi:hypothetical protein